MEEHMKNEGTRSALLGLLTVAGLCLGPVGCSSPPKQTDAQPPAAAQSSPTQARRYDLKGKVVSVDKSGSKLTVDHETIPGFMGAMTMAYPVKDEHLLDGLSPGDQVTAKVVASGGEFWLEEIVVASRAIQTK
jgi:protein SCO1/2